ncbi:MAG: cation:proton antiporter [Candidatus Bathyarchaeia archaeon]|nr:cation:proton antiporter [Candidatus Bathyarchaeota archaeon]
MDAGKLLLLFSSTIFLGYVSGLFYTKTRVPDMIWLLAFGILLGPVFGYFEREVFLSVSPLMSVIALCIILFDAGINIDIILVARNMVKSVLLTVATFLSIVFSVGFFLNLLMPQMFTLLQAILLGAMIGGASTIAVSSILNGMESIVPDIESCRVTLLMESILSDPICIITSIALIRMVMSPTISPTDVLKEIIYVLFLSSLLGFAIGLIWAEVLDRLRGKPFNYILTIAALFPTYIMAESLVGEGGGPIAALTLGLAMTNSRYIIRRLGVESDVRIDKRRLREFHEEITFMIKSFYFVYIGLTATLSLQHTLLGLGVMTLILIIRYAVATALGRLPGFTAQEKVISRIIFAQGLPVLVMSQLPMIFDPNRRFFPRPEIYTDLAVPIVIGTILVAAFLGPAIASRQLTKKPSSEESSKLQRG